MCVCVFTCHACLSIGCVVSVALVSPEIRGLFSSCFPCFSCVVLLVLKQDCSKHERRKTTLPVPQSKVTALLSLTTQLNFCLRTQVKRTSKAEGGGVMLPEITALLFSPPLGPYQSFFFYLLIFMTDLTQLGQCEFILMCL